MRSFTALLMPEKQVSFALVATGSGVKPRKSRMYPNGFTHRRHAGYFRRNGAGQFLSQPSVLGD
jgi:hypothetical protein